MEEILHHLGCKEPYEKWDILHIHWCRIPSINRRKQNKTSSHLGPFFWSSPSGRRLKVKKTNPSQPTCTFESAFMILERSVASHFQKLSNLRHLRCFWGNLILYVAFLWQISFVFFTVLFCNCVFQMQSLQTICHFNTGPHSQTLQHHLDVFWEVPGPRSKAAVHQRRIGGHCFGLGQTKDSNLSIFVSHTHSMMRAGEMWTDTESEGVDE